MLSRLARAGAKPSLRARLVRSVLLPLALTWGLGSIVVLAVGEHFAAQAFDRALLDDAHALAAHVHLQGVGLVLDLTPQERSTLLFDQSETIYFGVFRPDGRLITGEAGLTPVRIAPNASHEFGEQEFRRKHVRSVTLLRDEPAPFLVVMAQTTTSRTALLQRLILYSAAVQLWLLVTLAWWLRRSIQHDLRPLAQLQEAIEVRDAGDLAPLPPSLRQGATTLEVERLGDALDSLLARLQGSLDAQREFAGNVAHELRTPLAGIRAQARYALAQDDAQVWCAELQGIAQAEERASRLIDQLLALARAGEASTGLHLAPVALDQVARDIVLRYLRKADALGVDLGAEGLDQPVIVPGDIALIESVLTNLLDNALRYGRGAAPRVTVALLREGDAATLSVTDNGPGLESPGPSDLTRRWTQGAHGQQLGEGAGLGLAIVRRYAALLNAQFSIGPDPNGAGLCARLRFHCVPDKTP